jgi:hypothetical protein
VTTSRSAVAHQGAHSGRIAEIRFAHVRDQQYRALVQHGEEFLPDWVGIGHVYLHGQRDHGYVADPQRRIALSRHVPPPSVCAKSEEAASLDLWKRG